MVDEERRTIAFELLGLPSQHHVTGALDVAGSCGMADSGEPVSDV
ncbi:MAG: hypothetical protein JWN72_2107, partial [Thermoleophilia bacterium]|nr:hypothetical protein [Thermoleophilia bacterium]